MRRRSSDDPEMPPEATSIRMGKSDLFMIALSTKGFAPIAVGSPFMKIDAHAFA